MIAEERLRELREELSIEKHSEGHFKHGKRLWRNAGDAALPLPPHLTR
jgi:hypothetical protein